MLVNKSETCPTLFLKSDRKRADLNHDAINKLRLSNAAEKLN
jgi:hypothetical protein